MDCRRVDLIGYHFGVTDDLVRDEAEAHLKECARCLEAYLTLKRQLDAPRDAGLRPSDAARERLRTAVVRRYGAPRGLRGLLLHPVPLYQGLAVAALVLLCSTLASKLGRVRHAEPVATNEPPVDTARTTAESAGIY